MNCNLIHIQTPCFEKDGKKICVKTKMVNSLQQFEEWLDSNNYKECYLYSINNCKRSGYKEKRSSHDIDLINTNELEPILTYTPDPKLNPPLKITFIRYAAFK
jgi:hypothetical protein